METATISPEPPSSECILHREKQFYGRLRRKGFTDAVAEYAAGEAVVIATQTIQTRKVYRLENRTGWLWRVAFKAAKRASKREKNCPTTNSFDMYECPAEPWEDNSPSQVLWAFASLSEVQQDVVSFLVLREMSVPEAARILGLKQGSVRHHYKYAIRRLREACKAPGNSAFISKNL